MNSTSKKKNPESGNSDPQAQILYVFAYMWSFVVKSMITKLQSIKLQRLDTKGGKIALPRKSKQNKYLQLNGERMEIGGSIPTMKKIQTALRMDGFPELPTGHPS